MKTPTARHIISIICLLFLAGAIRSQAQNGTWTNNIMDPGTNRLDTTWSNSTNWLNGVVADGSGSTAFFNAVDIPSNSTIVVSANVTNLVSLTNGNMFFGDTVTASSPGNWIIADAGFPLTLDSTASPNSVIDVNLAQGAANNLTAGWSTATITANLAGTNNLVKTGPSHLILNPTSGNNYSGATIISNGMVQLGTANQAGTANATTLGGGLTPVYFRSGSLRLQNAAIPGSNPGNGGSGISAFPNPIIVEAGQTGTMYLPPRAFPAMSGTVSGGGTFNLVVDFVRDDLGGDWSGFTGQVNVISSTRQAGDLRFKDPFVTPGGWANARVTFTTNGVNANTINMYNNGTSGSVVRFGELSANVPNIVNIFANNTGAGAGNSLPFVLQIGELNTDASFSGNFSAPGVANGVGIIKEGTGTWTLNGATIENNGITVVNNGVLQIGSGTSGKLGRSSVVSNYATLAFGRTDTGLIVTNVIDGSGTVLQKGSGRTTLSPLTGANTYTGKTLATAGTLAIGTLSALGATPGSLVADQLTLNGGSFAATTNLSFNDVNRGITLGAAGGGLGADGANTLTVANLIGGAGNLTINNTGTVSPTGANNYTGKTILQSGTLLLASETPLGTAPGVATADQITFNGGTLRSSATFAIDDANRGITVNGAGGTISPDAATTLTISEPIAGTGTLTKSGLGILVLNGTVGSSVTTTVSEGTLQIGPAGSVASQSIVVPGGTTLDVTLAGGLVLASGQTLRGNGTVLGNVTAPAGSTISPGVSVGVLAITGNLTLSGGTNHVEISSVTNDLITVSGNVSLTGVSTIDLELLSALPVKAYPLIKYGGSVISGTPAANLVIKGYPVSRVTATLTNNTATKSIDLVISGTAGSLVWTGGQNGNAWNLNSTPNWLNGAASDVFLSADSVMFNAVGSTNPTVTLVGDLQPGPVTVDTAATGYTFTGSGRLTGLASLSKTNAGTLTVLTTNDYFGTTTISGGTLQVGNGTVSGSLGSGDITDNGTLAFNLPNTNTVSGSISGTGSLSVQGGTVVLAANNSYGASSISGGATLQVGNGAAAGSLGTGAVSDNGSLVFKRTGSITNSGAITGAGSLTVKSGTVALAANNSYAGATTVDTGTLQVGVGGTSGTLGTAGSVTLTNSGTLAFNRSDDLTNVVNVIGSGTLAKMGAGTLVITNDANAYNTTLITGGKLQLGDGVNSFGQLGRGTITVNSPGTLAFNRPDAYSLTNVVAGSGSLLQFGPTNLNITVLAGNNTYAGGTTISNSSIIFVPAVTSPIDLGYANVNGSGLGSGTVTFLGNAILQLAGATLTELPNGAVFAGNFANPIEVPVGATATINTPGRFAFSSAVSGGGTINYGVNHVRGDVSGSWANFTGTLNIISNSVNTNNPAHDFRAFNTNGFPTAKMHLEGTSLFWRGVANAIIPIGELSGTETAFFGGTGGAEGGNAVTWVVGGLNTDSTYAGTSGGSVAVGLTKVGTGKLTLTGANAYIGNTTVSNGTLALAPGTLGDGDISASAVITVVSPGVLDVSGRTDNSLNDNTVLAGNGTIVGSVVVNNTVSPGLSIGTLTVTSNIVFNGGILNIEVNRNDLQSDKLVAKNIVLNGANINVTNIGPNLVSGDIFTLLQAVGGTISGTFAIAGGFPLVGPQTGGWDTSQLLVNGTIIATNVPPAPTLTAVVNSGSATLDFSWPVEYTGYVLYAQTNTLAVGLSTNWVAVAGTEAVSTYSAPLGTTNGTVFFRLQYP